MYEKGDFVKIDAYATGYGSWHDVHGLVVSYDDWLGVARVLILGTVSIIPGCHLEKIGATDEEG